MASELIQRFRNDTAPRLLARFANGGTATVVRTVTPNPDPLQPGTVTESVVEFNAVAMGVSAQMLAADPNMLATDLRVICAAVDFVPEVGKMVQINGKSRAIIRVDAIIASGPPAAYRFYVR